MKAVRIALVAVALVALLIVVTGCSPTEGNLSGDGLHAVVPSVVGMSVENATAKLHDAGYEIGSVSPADADGSSVVQNQDPVAGTALPRGDQVDLQCVR